MLLREVCSFTTLVLLQSSFQVNGTTGIVIAITTKQYVHVSFHNLISTTLRQAQG